MDDSEDAADQRVIERFGKHVRRTKLAFLAAGAAFGPVASSFLLSTLEVGGGPRNPAGAAVVVGPTVILVSLAWSASRLYAEARANACIADIAGPDKVEAFRWTLAPYFRLRSREKGRLGRWVLSIVLAVVAALALVAIVAAGR